LPKVTSEVVTDWYPTPQYPSVYPSRVLHNNSSYKQGRVVKTDFYTKIIGLNFKQGGMKIPNGKPLQNLDFKQGGQNSNRVVN
jgi:hypothetical protein